MSSGKPTSVNDSKIVMPSDKEILASFRRPTFAELDKWLMFIAAALMAGMLLFLQFSLPISLLMGAVSFCACAIFLKYTTTISSWELNTKTQKFEATKTSTPNEAAVDLTLHNNLLYRTVANLHSPAEIETNELKSKNTLSL